MQLQTAIVARTGSVVPELVDIPCPQSVESQGGSEVLCRTLQLGICGTDREILHSANPWTPPGSHFLVLVLVTGMGPIGFAAALACLVRGWSVTMFGRDRADSFRATLAGRFGVEYWAAAEGCFDMQNVEQDGFDLVLECTGSDEVLVKATAALRSCGVMVWLGSTRVPRAAMLDVAKMMRNALLCNHLHVGTVNAAPRDFRDAITHLAQLKREYADELQSLITARVTPRDSLWHFEHRQPQGIKTVIEYPV